MTETYIKTLSKSSSFFLENAKEPSNKKFSNFFIISTIIHSWLLLEAYINYLGDILAKAKINPHERALLEDRELCINEDGVFIEKKSHSPVLKRVLFILHRFSTFDAKKLKQTDIWRNIKTCERIRNDLIHPKRIDAIQNLTVKKAEEMRSSVILFIQKLNKAVLGRDIRLD
jgi:hypothetical protein